MTSISFHKTESLEFSSKLLDDGTKWVSITGIDEKGNELEVTFFGVTDFTEED
jgi:hypothetical protein